MNVFINYLTYKLYSFRFKMSVVLTKKKLFQNECHFQFSMQ